MQFQFDIQADIDTGFNQFFNLIQCSTVLDDIFKQMKIVLAKPKLILLCNVTDAIFTGYSRNFFIFISLTQKVPLPLEAKIFYEIEKIFTFFFSISKIIFLRCVFPCSFSWPKAYNLQPD